MSIDSPIDVVWDTDIGRDPDDFLAGCFLLSRPEVRLRAITISPGDRDQIALAKFLLKEAGYLDVPVGVMPNRKYGQKSVSGCHLLLMKHYGMPIAADAEGAGWEVLDRAIRKYPESLVFTSGPFDNIGDLLKKADITIRLSVSMAGYWAGPGQPLSMPEFNFNGCGWAARAFVESKRFGRRLLVGKNVTHEVLYDNELHNNLREAGKQSRPLALATELMTLRSSRSQKKLHDPLAAAAIVKPDLFGWEEIMPVKRNNAWSSVSMLGSGIWAATEFDLTQFRNLFSGLE